MHAYFYAVEIFIKLVAFRLYKNTNYYFFIAKI